MKFEFFGRDFGEYSYGSNKGRFICVDSVILDRAVNILNLTESLVHLAPRGTQDYVNSPAGEDYDLTPFNSVTSSLYYQYDGARRIYDRLLVELEKTLSDAGALEDTGELKQSWGEKITLGMEMDTHNTESHPDMQSSGPADEIT
jgi:hypothetical protein